MKQFCLSHATIAVLALALAGTVACSSSDDSGGSSSGGSSGASSSSSGASGSSSSSSSGSSGGGGTCSGDITACAVGTLSSAQQSDMCSLLDAAVDEPPGTKYECKDSGLSLTVNSKETCLAQPAPKTCKVTVGYLIDCFKAAKKDACSALSESGSCAQLFDASTGCSG